MHCLLFIDQTLSGIWNLLIGILTWSIVPCVVWLVILAVIIVRKSELDISILTAQLKITWKMLAGMGKLLWKGKKAPLVMCVFTALLLAANRLLSGYMWPQSTFPNSLSFFFHPTATMVAAAKGKTHGIPSPELVAKTLREVAKNRKTRGGKQE